MITADGKKGKLMARQGETIMLRLWIQNSERSQIDCELEILNRNLKNISTTTESPIWWWFEWDDASHAARYCIRKIGAETQEKSIQWALFHSCTMVRELSGFQVPDEFVPDFEAAFKEIGKHRPLFPEEFREVLEADEIEFGVNIDRAVEQYDFTYRKLLQALKNQKSPQEVTHELAADILLADLTKENIALREQVKKQQALSDVLYEDELLHMKQKEEWMGLKVQHEELEKKLYGEIQDLANENSRLEHDLNNAKEIIEQLRQVIQTQRREKEIAAMGYAQRELAAYGVAEKIFDVIEVQAAKRAAEKDREQRRRQVREAEVDLDLAAADDGEKRLRRSLLAELEEDARNEELKMSSRNLKRTRSTQQQLLEDQTKRFSQFKK